MTPAHRARLDIRQKRHTGTTRGLAPGYEQCNLAVLPQALAFDFLLYCQRNARACPVLEVCDPGTPEPKQLAPGADLERPLYGGTVPALPAGMVPVFWACGVTPQQNFENTFVRELPADPVPANVPRPVRDACYTRVAPTPVAAARLLGSCD